MAVNELRAGVVVGPGGATFEVMVQRLERLRVLIGPRRIDRRCQPISLTDLVRYLVGCARRSRTRGETYDVGGTDVLRYSERFMRIGQLVHRPSCLVILPRFTSGLSAHWVGHRTEVSRAVARPVLDEMYVHAVCRDGRMRQERVRPTPHGTPGGSGRPGWNQSGCFRYVADRVEGWPTLVRLRQWERVATCTTGMRISPSPLEGRDGDEPTACTAPGLAQPVRGHPVRFREP